MFVNRPCVSVILLCMVGFIKDEKINLIDPYKRMHETLVKYLCRAYNDQILSEMFLPGLPRPQITSHFSTESLDLVAEIAFKNSKLLEDESYTIDLSRTGQNEGCIYQNETNKEERNTVFPPLSSVFQLLIDNMSQ